MKKFKQYVHSHPLTHTVIRKIEKWHHAAEAIVAFAVAAEVKYIEIAASGLLGTMLVVLIVADFISKEA